MPNDFLAEHYHQIPKGRVLSLAEGEGRNAVFLARKGYSVTAVDGSRVGLEKARKLADEHGVEIGLIHADLADFDIGHSQWEGIISIFCHQPSELRKTLHENVVKRLILNNDICRESSWNQCRFQLPGPSPKKRLTGTTNTPTA